jgi:hypothetical protein
VSYLQLYQRILTKSNNAQSVSPDSGTPERGFFQLLRPGDLLAVLDLVGEPERPPVEVEDEAEGRIGDLVSTP